MKDPAHPPGPDFGKASDTAEGQRQHMIAALDDRQREAFQQLKDQQAGKQQELQQTQENVRDEQIAQRMQRHLLPNMTELPIQEMMKTTIAAITTGSAQAY